MAEDYLLNQVFFDKYKTVKKLGQGSFGQVYKGEVREENTNLLETEAYRLIYLKGDGIPRVYCYGNNKTYNILVIELLGKSLEDLFNLCGRKFSLKTVCILGIEMLKRIQFVHEKNHIHRDIKPDNFMMGTNKNENSLYIIDFGLAKKYRSSTKKGHIPFRTNKNITGTARYCSVNTHMGYEQSRRDDLESIGYVLMYFLRGSLPWQGIKCRADEDHYQKIYEKKKITSAEELCRGFPDQFVKYFNIVKKLDFTQEPNYNELTDLFVDVLNNNCSETQSDFDWNNNLKSSTVSDFNIYFNQKANTSMLLGNKNLSHMSQNISNNDSSFNQMNADLNDMSIFQKDFDKKDYEPSIFKEEEQPVQKEKITYTKTTKNMQGGYQGAQTNNNINNQITNNERQKSPQKNISNKEIITYGKEDKMASNRAKEGYITKINSTQLNKNNTVNLKDPKENKPEINVNNKSGLQKYGTQFSTSYEIIKEGQANTTKKDSNSSCRCLIF